MNNFAKGSLLVIADPLTSCDAHSNRWWQIVFHSRRMLYPHLRHILLRVRGCTAASVWQSICSVCQGDIVGQPSDKHSREM